MSIYRRKVRGKDGVVQLSKVWTMSFKWNGQHISESTGQTSKTRARQVYDKRRQDLGDGAAGIKKELRVQLLSAAAKQWQTTRSAKWSPKMQSIAEYALKHLLPTLGRKLLLNIDAGDIAKYQKARLAEGASNRTVNIEVGILRQILKRHGAWERILNSDAWRDVGMLEEREDAGRALTAVEERVLLIECRESASRTLYPFIVLSLETGARFNTIRTLTWAQIDFRGRRLTIGKDKTKSGTGRGVPLSPRAMQTLEAWAEQFPNRKPAHFVFPSESYGLHGETGTFGGTVRPYAIDPTKAVGTLKSAWQSAKKRTRRRCVECLGVLVDAEPPAKAFRCIGCAHTIDELPAGLVDLRLHDLRHSAVSRMVAARIPLTTIAKIVGWSASTTVAMAARYAHPDDAELRQAVESISGSSEESRHFSRHLNADSSPE